MANDKVITIEDRIPKLKSQRKQKSNRRLIMYLSTFFFLILLVIYFQSSLSHITSIAVSGNHYINDESIIDMSGIEEGTSIWNVEQEHVVASIISQLHGISSATVQRKFPNSVEINVTEYSRVAYIFDEGRYFPILETGKILDEMPREHFPTDAPLLVNWTSETGEEVEEMAAELRKLPESMINRISEIYFTPVESDPLRITLYMNDGNEVSSTIRHFSERISSYPAIVQELSPDEKGIIHMRMNPYFEKFQFEEEIEIEGEG
ncbi:cell division protein FtsQ/DivIB [Anaerobacillus sp. MEB173]|uniref:cell division protein FtsQ/DivIB n=1 Tax=Anaerobacillus sp. MEB173 TaxID=3383345 RepID=UPI003F8FD0E7